MRKPLRAPNGRLLTKTPTAFRSAFGKALAAADRTGPVAAMVIEALRSRRKGFAITPAWTVSRRSKG